MFLNATALNYIVSLVFHDRNSEIPIQPLVTVSAKRSCVRCIGAISARMAIFLSVILVLVFHPFAIAFVAKWSSCVEIHSDSISDTKSGVSGLLFHRVHRLRSINRSQGW